MFLIVCVLIMVVCAALAIMTRQLLIAALWLAGVSAMAALLLYALGAREIAVIELSIGTGLVPVLFVFAITLMGKASSMPAPVVPPPLAAGLVVICLLLMGLVALQPGNASDPALSSLNAFSRLLWEDRSLDTLVQSVMIFATVISVLNLLAAVGQPMLKGEPV